MIKIARIFLCAVLLLPFAMGPATAKTNCELLNAKLMKECSSRFDFLWFKGHHALASDNYKVCLERQSIEIECCYKENAAETWNESGGSVRKVVSRSPVSGKCETIDLPAAFLTSCNTCVADCKRDFGQAAACVSICEMKLKTKCKGF